MKILIAGDGKVGATLTRQLSAEGYDLTLIDSNSLVLENSVEQYDVMAVRGNCAAKDTLEQAGVDEADLLIAATSADEVNLLCCMTAHGINPRLHTIARIRNPEYAEQIYAMREVFALSLAVNPEKQAATEIERLIKYPGFLKRDTFARGRVEIVELGITAESKLCGAALRDLSGLVKCKVLVCTVLRDGTAIAPDGSFILQPGDHIFVTAPTNDLSVMLKSLGIITRRAKHVILAGGGRVSYYLADRLMKDGISVKIIERDRARCLELSALLPGAEIINGDASNQSLMESEGLFHCDALVTMTGLDELNIIVSMYAGGCGVPQVITKLGRMDSVNMLGDLPIGSVVCPKELCCNTIVRYVRAMRNQSGAALSVHSIAEGLAEAMEFLVDGDTLHCGEPLKDLHLKPNVLIVSISHGARIEIPNGDSRFGRDDILVVLTSGETVLCQLNDIFA